MAAAGVCRSGPASQAVAACALELKRKEGSAGKPQMSEVGPAWDANPLVAVTINARQAAADGDRLRSKERTSRDALRPTGDSEPKCAPH